MRKYEFISRMENLHSIEIFRMRILAESRFYPNMEMHLATMSIGWQVETDTCTNRRRKKEAQNELPTQAIHK